MAKRTKKPATEKIPEVVIEDRRIPLGELLSEKPPMQEISFWVIGDSPLICHAWSEKAKKEMLFKQSKATKTGKEARNPEQDFVDSLYPMDPPPGIKKNGKKNGNQFYGFPLTGVKKAILSVAHKDRGVPRSDVMLALYLDAEMVKVSTAHPGAVCNLPLVRLYAAKPQMREDMVRIGSGLRKTANLAYRAEFFPWAIRLTGAVNPNMVPTHAVAFLTRQAGIGVGIGDWRNEKGGWAGAFHLGSITEEAAWDKYRLGKGPMPQPKPRMIEGREAA